MSSLEKWLRAMGLTKVQELELGNTQQTFFDQMKHELPGLHKLTMGVSDFRVTPWISLTASLPSKLCLFG